MEQLFKTTIRNFTNSIVIANKMRAKPYRKLFKTPKLTIKLSSLIGTQYFWNDKGYLVDVRGDIVPSNKSSAGQPRVWLVNFQDLYNGKLNPFSINARIQKLKEYVLPYFEDQEFINEVDLILETKFYLQLKGGGKFNIDIDNLSALWNKSILDCMKGVLIKDDDNTVVKGLISSVEFVDESEQKLEIILWKR